MDTMINENTSLPQGDGATFGEYSTTTSVNGVQSFLTPSVDAIPNAGGEYGGYQQYQTVTNELGMDSQHSISGGDIAQSGNNDPLIGDFTTSVNLSGTNNSPVDILQATSMIGTQENNFNNFATTTKINDMGESQGALVGANSSEDFLNTNTFQTNFDINAIGSSDQIVNTEMNFQTNETNNIEGFNAQTGTSFDVLRESGMGDTTNTQNINIDNLTASIPVENTNNQIFDNNAASESFTGTNIENNPLIEANSYQTSEPFADINSIQNVTENHESAQFMTNEFKIQSDANNFATNNIDFNATKEINTNNFGTTDNAFNIDINNFGLTDNATTNIDTNNFGVTETTFKTTNVETNNLVTDTNTFNTTTNLDINNFELTGNTFETINLDSHNSNNFGTDTNTFNTTANVDTNNFELTDKTFNTINIDTNNLGTDTNTFNTATNIDTNNFELTDKAFNTINIDTNNFEGGDSIFKTTTTTTIDANNFGTTENTSNIDTNNYNTTDYNFNTTTNLDTNNFTTTDNAFNVATSVDTNNFTTTDNTFNVATSVDTYNFTTTENNLKPIDNNNAINTNAFDLPNVDVNNFVNIERTTDLKTNDSISNYVTTDSKVFDATNILNNFETTNTTTTTTTKTTTTTTNFDTNNFANIDNNNLVTTDTTTNINVNDFTTPTSNYENFANITTETPTIFDTGVLKSTSPVIDMNPTFDINNFTTTETNNNFDINQLTNNYDINAVRPATEYDTSAPTTTSPILDTIPTFDSMVLTTSSPATDAVSTFDTKVTNLTSTPVTGQINDLNLNSIGFETSTPTVDTGLDLNLNFDQNQNITNYDNIFSTQALTPTVDSTQEVPSPVLDLGFDLANLKSTPTTTPNVDTVGTTIGEYQTVSPSLETNITTQIPQTTDVGSTFGEYQTTTNVNGIKSRFTPSIEPTPIQTQIPVSVPSTQTITTPQVKRVYVPVKKTVLVPKKKIVYVKTNKRVSLPRQSIPTSTTVIRKSIATIPQQTTALTSPYQVTTQTLRTSQNPLMVAQPPIPTNTIPIQNVVGASPTIPRVSLPYTPVIPQPLITQQVQQPIIPQQPIITQQVQQPIINQQVQQTIIPQQVPQPIITQQVQQPIIPQQVPQPIVPQQVKTIIPQQVPQPIIPQTVPQVIIPQVYQPTIPQQVPQPIVGQMTQPTIDQKVQPFIGQIPQTTVPIIQNQGLVASPNIQRIVPLQTYGMAKPATYNVSTYRPNYNRKYSVYNLGKRTNMTRPHLYGSRTYSARKL